MSVSYREGQNAEEIAKLLRTRGRIVVSGPARCGKTTELLRYAEERYPNGRFAVVAKSEDHPYIIRLHWEIYNGLTRHQIIAKRLLGEEVEGEDVMTPLLFTPEYITVFRTFNPSTPTFCDCWNSFTEAQRSAIMKRRLFIAAVQTKGEDDAKEGQDR